MMEHLGLKRGPPRANTAKSKQLLMLIMGHPDFLKQKFQKRGMIHGENVFQRYHQQSAIILMSAPSG